MNTSTPRSKVSSCFGLSSAGNRTCLVPILTCVCVLQIGLVDLEINRLTKLLFLATVLLSLMLLALKVGKSVTTHTFTFITCSLLQGFTGVWFIYFIRYIILFSYIIPIRYCVYPIYVHRTLGKRVLDIWMPSFSLRTGAVPFMASQLSPNAPKCTCTSLRHFTNRKKPPITTGFCELPQVGLESTTLCGYVSVHLLFMSTQPACEPGHG